MGGQPSPIGTAITAGSGGLSLANLIWALNNPNVPEAQKALQAAGLASQGVQAAGSLGGNPSLAGLGGGAGSVLGLGGGAYGLATSPTVGGKLMGATNLALAAPQASAATGVGGLGGLAPAAGAGAGYLAAATLSDFLINKFKLAQGGSALNKYTAGVDALVKPQGVSALFGGRAGKMNTGQALTGFTEDAFGASPFMAALGLGPWHTPTTGTMYRRELGNVFGQLGLHPDTKQYNSNLSRFDQGDISAANQLGARLSGFAPHAGKNPGAYSGQAASILLNSYGGDKGDLPSMAMNIMHLLDSVEKRK